MGPPSPTVRDAPPRRAPRIAVALAVLLLVPTLPAPPASAQTEDEIAVALSALGGGTAAPAVLVRLARRLAEPVPAVLPPDGLVGLVALDPTALAAAVEAWSDVAQDWRIVGRELGAQVCDCRDGLVADGCDEELRARLWLRHAELLRANLAERFARAALLAEPDRARREAALTQERDRAVERLQRLELSGSMLLGRLEQDRERLREHAEELGRIGAAGREGRS
jgi:hypothetical protein